MKRKNILMLGAALLMTAPAYSATPDHNDGVKQTVTVNEETVNGTVSEIRIDGNNAVLLFTDGTTLTADMRLVTITMSYDSTTSLSEKGTVNSEKFATAPVYDLQGRKIANSQQPTAKGLYIQNGKKLVNKKK